jgi:hypothetical protein
MATRVAKAKKTVSTESNTVTFEFTGGDSFVANLNELPEGIRARLALHGLAQKLGDTYAGDVESPRFEVGSLFAELAKGTWSQRAESGGPRVTALAEALAELRAAKRLGNPKAQAEEVDIEAAVAKVETMTDDEKKTARANPTIAQKMLEIKVRKDQAKLRDARKNGSDAETVDLDF